MRAQQSRRERPRRRAIVPAERRAAADAAAGSRDPPAGAGPAARPRTGARPGSQRGQDWLYGRHAVAAALANPARRWRRLAVLAVNADEALALAAAARAERRGAGEPVQLVEREALERLLPTGAVHQGWALLADPPEPADLDDVLRAAETRSGRSVFLALDQVTDPHNVGAILRSAAAFGAGAVIVTAHNAPPAGGALAKTASGALEAVPLVRAANLAQALDRLKAAGYWCCGLDANAPAALAGLDLGRRVVLVLGAEGGGLRRLVRERCDFLARLPTRPELPSLNVSNAAAIALYELVRGEDAG
jgi:23S rRNA (guanosine2251-2'-O)-methyltransferase